ncbi:hypothetical protein MBLNU13_g10320t1 [Cladosporium sp. NU13]
MGNLAVTLRSIGRRQSALNLISLSVEMSQARLGIDHPDTIARLSWKAVWEEEDTEEGIEDDVWVAISDGEEEEEKEEEVEDDNNDEFNDDDDDDEATGEETDKGAKPSSTESPNGNLLDSTVDGNRWNQPQFLWML